MATLTFSVTAIVRFLNKPQKSVHVLVQASNSDQAKKEARKKIQKKYPGATVQFGSVR
ncbi:hypothetical protein AB0J38_02225 [Streptomyces sp. NPDC050095]|uniref:hypothetical protein n=1 Tax=unclassified Streptomyces TaxID=2593676 RepID=UPI0034389040